MYAMALYDRTHSHNGVVLRPITPMIQIDLCIPMFGSIHVMTDDSCIATSIALFHYVLILS